MLRRTTRAPSRPARAAWAALALLEQTAPAAEWLGAELCAAYLPFKRAEIHSLEHLDEDEICRRYAEVY